MSTPKGLVAEVIAETFKRLGKEPQIDGTVLKGLEELAGQGKLTDGPAVQAILHKSQETSHEIA